MPASRFTSLLAFFHRYYQQCEYQSSMISAWALEEFIKIRQTESMHALSSNRSIHNQPKVYATLILAVRNPEVK